MRVKLIHDQCINDLYEQEKRESKSPKTKMVIRKIHRKCEVSIVVFLFQTSAILEAEDKKCI